VPSAAFIEKMQILTEGSFFGKMIFFLISYSYFLGSAQQLSLWSNKQELRINIKTGRG
jgi:hypothetical protein